MNRSLRREVAALAADHASSATALLTRALDLLRRARDVGRAEAEEVACAVCRAQPCMGSLWNAAASAIAAEAAALDRFAVQAARAPEAVARIAESLIRAGEEGRAAEPTLVTWSASRPVRSLVERLAQRGPVTVRCGEARPALEGRALAGALAAAGATVEVFADGALGTALAGAQAVVVGADAVAAEWFVNKAGTGALALAAASVGVPTYVLAGRDKCLAAALAGRLVLAEGPPEEVWAPVPAGVRVRNPYFERVPWTAVAALVTDRGVLGEADVPALCEAAARVIDQQALATLLAAPISPTSLPSGD